MRNISFLVFVGLIGISLTESAVLTKTRRKNFKAILRKPLTYNNKGRINCGNQKLFLNGGESVSVTSPNYPANFDTSSNCLWRIKTSRGYRLQVTLEDLVLPSCKHILTIGSTYGRTLPIRECGLLIGTQSLISEHNYLLIRFKTSYHGNQEKGFNITVTSVKTGKLMSGTTKKYYQLPGPFTVPYCFRDPCDINLCQNGGTCVPTDTNSFKCQCTNNTSGLFCENVLDCVQFPGATNAGITCCTNIMDVTSCEAEPACTFIKSGCIFDCGSFSQNPDICKLITTCENIPEIGDVCVNTKLKLPA